MRSAADHPLQLGTIIDGAQPLPPAGLGVRAPETAGPATRSVTRLGLGRSRGTPRGRGGLGCCAQRAEIGLKEIRVSHAVPP